MENYKHKMHNQQLDGLSNTVVDEINHFRDTNERYGYSTKQVNDFFDKIINLVRFYNSDGKSNSSINTIDNGEDSRKDRFDKEYKVYGNRIINIINDIKFTQGFSGYDTLEVDNSLDDLIKLIKDHGYYEIANEPIDTHIIRDTNFTKGFRGYDSKEVNEFMNKIALEFEKLNSIKRKYI